MHINHLIFSNYFRADVSCSKLPLRWLDIRAKCDGVGGPEISTQSFLDDDLSSIKHLRIQLLCRGEGERSEYREVIMTPLATLNLISISLMHSMKFNAFITGPFNFLPISS